MSGRSAASLSDPVLCGPGGYFHWMSIGTSARKEDEVKGLFSRYIGEEVSRTRNV